MAPKVSVIIPVYNTEEHLGACLDAVLMQSLEDIEVICVDDGSKDDSLSILKTYAFLDSRIKILTQEHLGAACARNKGLAEATGEFVCFFCSADFFDPDLLKKMVQLAEENKADVVMSGYRLFDNGKNEITVENKLDGPLLDHNPCKPEDLHDDLFGAFPQEIWNKLIRRNLINKYQLNFDETAGMMHDFVLQMMVLAGSNNIAWINDYLICHRINFRPTKKENKLQELEDDFKAASCLCLKLQEVSLWQKFIMPYLFWLKSLLWHKLERLPLDQKGQGFQLLLKYLPDTALKKLIDRAKCGENVSIVVPVYNAQEFLPECLDSLIHQTMKEIEIICVNDGSTDNSLEILNEYAKKDHRIRVISQENMGPSIARKVGMEAATGTYIQFVDADDMLEPNACEVLYFYARFFYLDVLTFAETAFQHKTNEEFEDSEYSLKELPETCVERSRWLDMVDKLPLFPAVAGLTIYRRLFLLKQGISWLNKKIFFSDVCFFVESIFKNAHMGVINMPLYRRRVHSQAVTQQMSQHFSDLISVLKYTLKLLPKLKVPKVIIDAYVTSFFDKVYSVYRCFAKEEEEKLAPTMYKFSLYMLKKYHIQFSDKFLKWVKTYQKGKKLKTKLQFRFYQIWSKLFYIKYHLSLFELVKSPDFSLKILSIPVVELKKCYDYELHFWKLKIFGYLVLSIEESWED